MATRILLFFTCIHVLFALYFVVHLHQPKGTYTRTIIVFERKLINFSSPQYPLNYKCQLKDMHGNQYYLPLKMEKEAAQKACDSIEWHDRIEIVYKGENRHILSHKKSTP